MGDALGSAGRALRTEFEDLGYEFLEVNLTTNRCVSARSDNQAKENCSRILIRRHLRGSRRCNSGWSARQPLANACRTFLIHIRRFPGLLLRPPRFARERIWFTVCIFRASLVQKETADTARSAWDYYPLLPSTPCRNPYSTSGQNAWQSALSKERQQSRAAPGELEAHTIGRPNYYAMIMDLASELAMQISTDITNDIDQLVCAYFGDRGLRRGKNWSI